METHSPLDKLRAHVRAAEENLRSSVPDEFRQIALSQVITAIDGFQTRVLAGTLDDETNEFFRFGVNKSLSLLVRDEPVHTYPLSPATQTSKAWSDTFLLQCGTVSIGEMIASYSETGLGELTVIAPDHLSFRYIQGAGIEALEAAETYWFQDQVRKAQAEVLAGFSTESERIYKLMTPRVFRWREHFIGYSTTPEIDSYFAGLGLVISSQMYGHDSFPVDVRFGGLEFGIYCAAVAASVGFALKHHTFCGLLMRQYPKLDPRNLVSAAVYLREDQCAGFSHLLEIDVDAARQVLDVLTMGHQNAGRHAAIPGSPGPPFVSASRVHVVPSLRGRLNSPFQFLLTELRERYRGDWDRAVNEREETFREDLYRLFPGDRFLTIPTTVRLRVGKREATDLDAVVFDRETGVLGIFQLKWQDNFGTSMRMRASHSKNFRITTEKWVRAVSSWLHARTRQELASTLKLTRAESQSITAIRLFVLGRTFAHFTGTDKPSDEVAWGVWHQVGRLSSEGYDPRNPLEWLYNALRADSPHLRQRPVPTATEITVDGVKVSLTPP